MAYANSTERLTVLMAGRRIAFGMVCSGVPHSLDWSLQSLRNPGNSITRINRVRRLLLQRSTDLIKVVPGLLIRSGLVHEHDRAIGLRIKTRDPEREFAGHEPFGLLVVWMHRNVPLDAELSIAEPGGVVGKKIDLQTLESLNISSAEVGGVD